MFVRNQNFCEKVKIVCQISKFLSKIKKSNFLSKIKKSNFCLKSKNLNFCQKSKNLNFCQNSITYMIFRAMAVNDIFGKVIDHRIGRKIFDGFRFAQHFAHRGTRNFIVNLFINNYNILRKVGKYEMIFNYSFGIKSAANDTNNALLGDTRHIVFRPQSWN